MIMKGVIFFFLLIGLFTQMATSQDLLGERIRKITSRKKAIFLDRGIFHNSATDTKATLIKIRHHYSKKAGYERIVFDFSSNKIPRVYGHISPAERRFYIDFFSTSVNPQIDSFGESKYVEGVNIFPLSKESLSVELDFKQKVSVDIFYLESPARLVIDVKS
jgi:hypothetical protein